jgi:hypothetical protein
VIGGIIRERTAQARSGIPFLSELPLLGYLFGTTTDTKTRTELILMVTPHVVANAEEADMLTEEYATRVKGLKRKIEEREKEQGGHKDEVSQADIHIHATPDEAKIEDQKQAAEQEKIRQAEEMRKQAVEQEKMRQAEEMKKQAAEQERARQAEEMKKQAAEQERARQAEEMEKQAGEQESVRQAEEVKEQPSDQEDIEQEEEPKRQATEQGNMKQPRRHRRQVEEDEGD